MRLREIRANPASAGDARPDLHRVEFLRCDVALHTRLRRCHWCPLPRETGIASNERLFDFVHVLLGVKRLHEEIVHVLHFMIRGARVDPASAVKDQKGVKLHLLVLVFALFRCALGEVVLPVNGRRRPVGRIVRDARQLFVLPWRGVLDVDARMPEAVLEKRDERCFVAKELVQIRSIYEEVQVEVDVGHHSIENKHRWPRFVEDAVGMERLEYTKHVLDELMCLFGRLAPSDLKLAIGQLEVDHLVEVNHKAHRV